MASLIEVIGAVEPGILGIAYSMVLDDYDAVAETLTPDARVRIGTPYDLCTQFVVRDISHKLAQHGVVKFVASVGQSEKKESHESAEPT